ncbi:MAG: magnesium transporter CorA family protein [Sinobacteraceae bacterium]|nr:magnesium transporter CorA family protein [Nevskiaceae bacterium]
MEARSESAEVLTGPDGLPLGPGAYCPIPQATIHYFAPNQPPWLLRGIGQVPDQGLLWIDFERGRAQGWECWIEPILGVAIEPEHVEDAMADAHPSIFDGTPQYDILVFEGLGPGSAPLPIQTRCAAFFLFERVLVTVRTADSASFELAKQRLAAMRGRWPQTPLQLAHFVLDLMVDRYLAVRDRLDAEFTRLQDELLDPKHPMRDWRALLVGRREVRKLESLSEAQSEALDAWRRNSCFDWTPADEVRVRDLIEHVGRVRAHAGDLQRDLEAAVQLHFASLSHRTNEIMRIFTVVSVVFMPPMLLTGIWGMNFKFMPELEWRYGYPLALTAVFGVCIGMLVWFKRRRLF